MKASIDLFDPEHLNHLLAEGFTHELINAFVLNPTFRCSENTRNN